MTEDNEQMFKILLSEYENFIGKRRFGLNSTCGIYIKKIRYYTKSNFISDYLVDSLRPEIWNLKKISIA